MTGTTSNTVVLSKMVVYRERWAFKNQVTSVFCSVSWIPVIDAICIQPPKISKCERRVRESPLSVLPVIDIHGYLGVSTEASAAVEAAAAEARGWW